MNDKQMIEKFGWQSRVEVGGFINLDEAPALFQERFSYGVFMGMSAWPDSYETMPSDKEGLRNFAKAAKAKVKTLFGTVSVPFGMPSYKEGGQYLKDQGLVQYHTSISVNGIDYAVHWWGANDPDYGYRHDDGAVSWQLAKIKIDTQEQLDGILNP